MLKAKLLRDGSTLTGYEIKGHAGFDEYGKDVVCAGVSALAQTALLGLCDLLGSVNVMKESGYLKVSLSWKQAQGEGPKAVLRTLELGLKAIEKSYEGSLKVL